MEERRRQVTTEDLQIRLRVSGAVSVGQMDGEARRQWGSEEDTHLGKSDFPESSIVILYLHLLHQRTNN